MAEAGDVRFGRYGSFDEYEDCFYVDCVICGERYRWLGHKQIETIPPNIQRDARAAYDKANRLMTPTQRRRMRQAVRP